MAVSNGQDANQTTFNSAFLSRTQNSDTTGVVGLKNTTDVNSGALITNAQRLINEVRDTVGVTGEGDTNRKVYSSNNFVANGDDHKVAIGKLDAGLATMIPLSQKGAVNGVAELDSGGRVPVSQLPISIMEFKGSWDASTNSPTLADGVGNQGDVYRVTVAGTQNLGSGSLTFNVGDWVAYDGSIWQLTPNSDSFTGVLANDQYLYGRNAGNTDDIPISKISVSDTAVFGDDGIFVSQYIELDYPANINRYFTDGQNGIHHFYGVTMKLQGDGVTAPDMKFITLDGAKYIALKAPDTIAASKTFILPVADGTSGQALLTDGAGQLYFGSVAAAVNFVAQRFSGDGSTTGFTLSSAPGAEENTQVFISGVYQQKDTYSVSGTTLTFSTAPPSGTDNIEVMIGATVGIGTPSDGSVTDAKTNFTPPTRQIFTSGSGTYTKPSTAKWIRIRMVGGGAGGGGAAATGASQGACGGGGGAGAYLEKVITSPSSSYSYAVGAAGAGSSGANGGAGGNSTFDTLTANGGSGGVVGAAGTNSSANGGGGGSASGGDTNVSGQAGHSSLGGNNIGQFMGGAGGSNPIGFGGASILTSNAGLAATGYGGGGGGASIGQSLGAQAGGSGTAGIIIVEEYYQ